MRTLLLLSTAAASLFGGAQSASAFTQNPAPALDYGAPGAPDDRVYAGNADRAPAASETPPPAQPDAVYGGSYDAEGRWAEHQLLAVEALEARPVEIGDRDRKSTRLNSRH